MAAPTILVLALDPYHPKLGLIVPVVAQRILDFSRQYYREIDAMSYTRAVMTRLWARDEDVLIVAFVEPEAGQVVGHAVLTIETDGKVKWVFGSQVKADGNVGDAVRRMFILADEWGRERGVENMVISSVRNNAAWNRKYGFKEMRHLMVRKLGSFDSTDEPAKGAEA